ncbi:GNAT family N-acetyltransferase [Nocardia gipuzkoensis]
MPKSKKRKPKKTERRHQPPARSAARKPALREFVSGPIRVREARTVEELREFERWASMAGAGGPRTAARLVEARTEGVLGAGLGDPDSSHEAMLAAVMRGDFEAVTWTRTMALVATLDGEVVGGLLAGPAAQFLGDLADKHNLAPTAVLGAVLFTCKLHFIAVSEPHRRRGVGEALMRAAVSTAFLGGAQIMYGQFLSADRGLAEFYRRQGFTLMKPDTGLNFAAWLGGFPGGPMPLPGEQFFCRDLTTIDEAALRPRRAELS